MNQVPTYLGMIGASLLSIGQCNAQAFDTAIDTPSMDRWNYPFNGSPGFRLSASTFGAVELEGFDDHDAQYILGFDTTGLIPVGLATSEYDVISVRVTITNTAGDEFRYDSTYDTHDTYLYFDESLDTDLGRPIHLWGVGYRNGYDQSSWGEHTVFGGTPVVDPTQGARHAFACDFPTGIASPRDVSNNLKEEFDPSPMAVGQVDSLPDGEFVPVDTDFVFDADLCDSDNQDYLKDSLAAGELRFAVTSLSTASGGKGGGTGDIQYPFWYTRENAIAQLFGYTPRIEIRVRIGGAGDYDGNGTKDIFDVLGFISDYNAGHPDADIERNCALDIFDVLGFISSYNS